MNRYRRSIVIAVSIASSLFILDAFILNQGGIAAITAIAVIFVMLPRAVLAWREHDRELAQARAMKAAVYALMVIGVFGANYLNNALAQSRAEELITAARHYEARHHRLPDGLQDLAPDFIPEVPLAKYTLLFNNFRYIAIKGRHSLFWVDVPPFGRPTYRFEENKWDYID